MNILSNPANNTGMSRDYIYKFKIAGIVTGVAIAVCIVFKYLLPIAAPFVIAFLLALLIDRPVTFFEKKFHIKRSIGSVILLLVGGAVLTLGLFYGGRALAGQVNRLAENYDKYVDKISRVADEYCCKVDDVFDLKEGTSYRYVTVQVEKGIQNISDSAMVNAIGKSMDFIAGFTIVFTAVTIAIMATVFFSKDFNRIKKRAGTGLFGEEIKYLGVRMKEVLGTYFKTQFIIMGLTSVICTAGLYFMGNPYAFLLGVLIGIVDAFPILGTGTVFLPWCIVLILMKNFKQAVFIFLLYIVCYYTRQFLEPKLMGDKLGISPVMMLASIYVGMLLFGIVGVFTGPVAYVLIKEIAGIILMQLEK